MRMTTEEDKENGAAATGEVSKMDTAGADASVGPAAAEPPAEPPADDPAAESESESEDDESSDDDAVGPDGMTKYERQRQANIARNKLLMQQLTIDKMADKLKPVEPEPVKRRGPKGSWKKKRAAMKPSRGSSRIQQLQEERKHTAWKDVHVEKSLSTHPHCFVDLTVQCLGMADGSFTFGEPKAGDEHDDEQMLPLGFFAEGEFMNESLYVWVDFEGKHHVMWGESEGEFQRHVETEEGGCDTAAGAALCILRESQRRRLEQFGSIPSKGVAENLNLRVHHSNLPLLDKNAPPPTRPGPIMHFNLPGTKMPKDPKTPKASTYVRKTWGPTSTGRPRGRPRKHPLPLEHGMLVGDAITFTVPKQKREPREPSPPPRPDCVDCGRKREDTTRMRHGPEGKATLCNACGMFWATQGRARPAGLFEDDYERHVPSGVDPVTKPSLLAGATRAAKPKTEPVEYKKPLDPFDAEINRLIEEADEDATKSDGDDNRPIADMVEDEEESEEESDEDDNMATEALPPGQVDPDAVKPEHNEFGPAITRPAGARTFFSDMVKCASAGLVTPGMVGADDFPRTVPEGAVAPRWCPHLWAGSVPLVGITEDAAHEVKRDPQTSAVAKAVAVVADSDPVKDAGWEKLAGYPNQAWYATRSAALALAGYGGTAAGFLIGKPAIFPTKFALPNMPHPRAYVESDLDGVTLFGYAETEVQQGLQAQLEKYAEIEEREGADAAEKQRELDMAEAVANLDAAIYGANSHMGKSDARADRDAKFERAQTRIEVVAAAIVLCPPLPQVEKPSSKGRGTVEGDNDDVEPAGHLTETVCLAIAGAEDIPKPLNVVCGVAPPGVWQPGGRPKEEKIFVAESGDYVSPADYERLGGMGQAKKWRKSIRTENGQALGEYLANLGAEKGAAVVGNRLGIWWPLDQSFYLGTVEGFIHNTGEHSVRYDDGEIEDLLLAMQRVKWLPKDTGFAGAGMLLGAGAVAEKGAADEMEARRKAGEEARRAEELRIEQEHEGILSPEGRYRVRMGAFDVWASRPVQWKMRNSERRKCFEVLTALRNEPDPDDDPDDEDEPPRLLIEPFEQLPGPRELPDYYELIRCPVDCRSIERALRRSPERSYASPWFFACAVELMLTNAQTYNESDSQIYDEAGMLRRAFHKAMSVVFPHQPLPESIFVYESCDEPGWYRRAGWTPPLTVEEVNDEAEPFAPLPVEEATFHEEEERALARAVTAGGAMYGYGTDPDHLANLTRRFGRAPGRPGRPAGVPKPAYQPTGKPRGRPRLYLRPEDEPPRDTKLDTQAQNRVVVRDVAFDPKKPNAPDTARVGVGGKKRMYAGVSLGPAATAARDALYAANGAALSLDDLVAAVEKSGAPEVAGARRVNAAVSSILRQHPDVFLEALTGTGAKFTLHPTLMEEETDHGPPRAVSGRVAKKQKSYADSDGDDEMESESEDDADDDRAMTTGKVEQCRIILQKAREVKVKGRTLSELFELLPTRKQMPEYYRQIANPVDYKSIAASLKRAGGHGSVWDFLISVELMFSNAQVYNEKESQIFKDAEAQRKVIKTALEKAFPGHPYPAPMSVYEPDQVAEPDWRAKKKPLSVKLTTKGKGAPLKVTLQGAKCGVCVNCLEPTRRKRCLDAQMRDAARDGHEGAKIAAEGTDVIGVGIDIYWPPEDIFYKGKITGFDPKTCAHQIQYDNGDVETMELWKEEEQVKRSKK